MDFNVDLYFQLMNPPPAITRQHKPESSLEFIAQGNEKCGIHFSKSDLLDLDKRLKSTKMISTGGYHERLHNAHYDIAVSQKDGSIVAAFVYYADQNGNKTGALDSLVYFKSKGKNPLVIHFKLQTTFEEEFNWREPRNIRRACEDKDGSKRYEIEQTYENFKELKRREEEKKRLEKERRKYEDFSKPIIPA